jgi:hypothetical protein
MTGPQSWPVLHLKRKCAHCQFWSCMVTGLEPRRNVHYKVSLGPKSLIDLESYDPGTGSSYFFVAYSRGRLADESKGRPSSTTLEEKSVEYYICVH